MNGRHVAESTQTNEYPYLEQIHGEDPARFLETNELTATARIGGIRYPEILEAYEYVAKQITVGSYRTSILEAIEERKADLGLTDDELTESPTPETTADPVPATDGGTTLEYDESDETADTPESDPDQLHPDTKGLVAGEVLELERADRTDYIFPATHDTETPYLLRAFDGDDERTDAPIGLTFDEVAKRIDGAHDPKSVSEIDVRAPELAASNGGESA